MGEVSGTRMAFTEAATDTTTEDASTGITLDEVASNEITNVIVSTSPGIDLSPSFLVVTFHIRLLITLNL